MRVLGNPRTSFCSIQAHFLQVVWAPGQHSPWEPIWHLGSHFQEVQKYRNAGSTSELLSSMLPSLGTSPFREPQADSETHSKVGKPLRIANTNFFFPPNYFFISRLSSDMLILKICLPTVQLRFSEHLAKPFLLNVIYDFYATLVLW